MKRLVKILSVLAAMVLIITFTVYCSNGGRLTEKSIDLSLLEDVNPVRRELNIEACTTATITVVSLDDFAWAGVIAEFEEAPDVSVNVYLSSKDISKIDVGDVIIVKGRINYMSLDNDTRFNHAIVIGSAISVPPYSFDAKLVDISSSVIKN